MARSTVAKKPTRAKGRAAGKDTLLRHWRMLHMIPPYPHTITNAELHRRMEAEGYAVTERTIQRDLIKLSGQFQLMSDESEAAFKWCWMKDAALDVPMLPTDDALAFAMVERFLQPLLPNTVLARLKPQFERAEKRLDQEAPRRGSHSWLGKVAVELPTQALIPPPVSAKVQSTVSEALLKDRQVRARYRRKGHEVADDLVLSPLALVQRGPIAYVLGMAAGHGEKVYPFALHRIEAAEMLGESFERPSGFSLEDELVRGKLAWGSGKTIHLKVIFTRDAAAHLEETPLSTDQKLTQTDPDHVCLVATVPDTLQLRWWLLGFGRKVEVVAPAALRREFADHAAAMAAIYASGAKNGSRTTS